MPGTIQDPKMNVSKEANFGVLFDDSNNKEVYYLYYKGDFNQNNPKRYFTAGTKVTITSEPEDLNIKKYKYDDGKVHENISEWVEIDSTPAAGTGPVTNQINNKIKGNIDFPEEKELLSEYTSNSPSR